MNKHYLSKTFFIQISDVIILQELWDNHGDKARPCPSNYHCEQEPNEAGNTGPRLADNQSRDLNNEFWLVVIMSKIRFSCNHILSKWGYPNIYGSGTLTHLTHTHIPRVKCWAVWYLVRVRSPQSFVGTNRTGNAGPWLADNQSRDLNNKFWLAVYLVRSVHGSESPFISVCMRTWTLSSKLLA